MASEEGVAAATVDEATTTGPGQVQGEEWWTEAATMAFYVAVCLIAALSAIDSADDVQAMAVIWGTTVGLALAHLFAFHLARALVTPGARVGSVRSIARAQLVGATLAGLIATVPTLLLESPADRAAALATVAVFIGGSGFLLARGRGAHRTTAIVFAVVVLVLALAIAYVKNVLVGH